MFQMRLKQQHFIAFQKQVSHFIPFETEELTCAKLSGAPNDQFVVKCIIIPQLMKINVIKAFSGVFQCCWENIICSFFPARHTRNFPASYIKLVGFPASGSNLFPSQEFRALSNPSIQNDRTKATKPGQNRFSPQAQSL